MEYQVYQVRQGITRDFGWMGLAERSAVLGTDTIALSEVYESVYSGELEHSGDTSAALDKIYRILNTQRPADYQGRSVSVSDVIQIDRRFYYCDSFGWAEVTAQIA